MKYCDGMMYAVKKGDTLYSISMKYRIPLAVLLRANPYVDVYNLQVGETICVPVTKNDDNVCRYPYDDRRCMEDNNRRGMEDNDRRGMEDNDRRGMEDNDRRGMEDNDRRGMDDNDRRGMEDNNRRGREDNDRREDRDRFYREETESNIGEMEMENTNIEDADEEEEAMLTGDSQMDEVIVMESNNVENGDISSWEKYVVQPGDTLNIAMGNMSNESGENTEDTLMEFVERNGIDRIFLLPGVSYQRRR